MHVIMVFRKYNIERSNTITISYCLFMNGNQVMFLFINLLGTYYLNMPITVNLIRERQQ